MSYDLNSPGPALNKVAPDSGAVVPVVYFTADSGLGRNVPGLAPVGRGRLLVETVNADGTYNTLVSDGTAAGTVPLRSHVTTYRPDGPAAAVIRDGFVFVADDGAGGQALWRSDGTPVGTVEVPGRGSGRTSRPGASAGPS